MFFDALKMRESLDVLFLLEGELIQAKGHVAQDHCCIQLPML